MPKAIKNRVAFDRWFFTAAVLLCGLSATLLLAAYNISRPASPSVRAKAFNQSDTVQQGQVSFRIDSVKRVASAHSFQAPAGKEYLVVSVDIQNRSSAPAHIYPSTDMYVKTSDGVVSNLTPFELKNPLRAGQLLPGDRLKGELSFLVQAQTAYTLYLEAGWSGAVVPITLN